MAWSVDTVIPTPCIRRQALHIAAVQPPSGYYSPDYPQDAKMSNSAQ